MKKIYLASPTMHGEEQEFVKEAFDTNWIAPLGPNVNAFEKEIADTMGEGFYAAALSSGTAALHLADILCGIKEGDLVFCQDLTFSATVNPILYEKARPVFIDSERETWNMDPEALKRAFEIYGKPKAVIVVNLYGTPAKLEEISEICEEWGVPLIEDAAESLGSSLNGKNTGTFGAYGILSFNGNKIITSSGGGMLVSDKEEKIARARFLSTQSREAERHYEHKVLGYNYRMSNVVAGVGRGQLLHLKEHIEKKKAIYMQYKEAFSKYDFLEMNPVPENVRANYWLSCMTIKKEAGVKPIDLMIALEKENIESRPIWKPMHLQPVFSEYDFVPNKDEKKEKSVSEDIFERGICLPSDIKNTKEDMERIISIVCGEVERRRNHLSVL